MPIRFFSWRDRVERTDTASIRAIVRIAYDLRIRCVPNGVNLQEVPGIRSGGLELAKLNDGFGAEIDDIRGPPVMRAADVKQNSARAAGHCLDFRLRAIRNTICCEFAGREIPFAIDHAPTALRYPGEIDSSISSIHAGIDDDDALRAPAIEGDSFSLHRAIKNRDGRRAAALNCAGETLSVLPDGERPGEASGFCLPCSRNVEPGDEETLAIAGNGVGVPVSDVAVIVHIFGCKEHTRCSGLN